MNRLRRALGALCAAALMLTGVAVMASPAEANHVVSCGSNITSNTTLRNDVGPCPSFGLHVAANNITINLNGHRLFGANGPEETAGIHLMNVSGVAVRNGRVEGFDAGVSIEGGGNNTIQRLTVQNNVNDLSTTEAEPCIYGDGITVLDSDDNRIMGNTAVQNGPYSGISLVGDSDGNVVSRNVTNDNNATNILPNGQNGPCGPFTPPGAGPGRRYQDIGIRVEGPGANNNMVRDNVVQNNMLNGISIHGNLCHPPPPPPGGTQAPPLPPNNDNTVLGNFVRANGFGDPTDPQDGIAILRQGPIRVVCVAFNNRIERNVSIENARDGVFVGAPTTGNAIERNVVDRNRRTGIFLAGPAMSDGQPVIDPTTGQPFTGAINNLVIRNEGTGNSQHDGHDGNPDCDNNVWFRNRLDTVNQSCVAAYGRPGRPTAPPDDEEQVAASNHPGV